MNAKNRLPPKCERLGCSRSAATRDPKGRYDCGHHLTGREQDARDFQDERDAEASWRV